MNKIQTTLLKQKRIFNPSDADDMASAKQFLTTYSWGTNGCPFVLEWPFLNISDMIKDKITKQQLGI